MIYKSATIKVLDGKANGPWDVLISTDSLDRQNDTINQGGWMTDNYMRNPVVMWAHDYYGMTPSGGVPVGLTHSLRLDPQGLIANFSFRKAANDGDFVNVVQSAWEQEVLRAASVGFAPVETTDNQIGGRNYIKQELLEWSICAIPANAEALRRSYEGALKAAGMGALLRIKSQSDLATLPPTEPIIDDTVPAPTDEPAELTPEQLAALAAALHALNEALAEQLAPA
jgi:HK97 family phage prohead protease